MTNEKQLTHIDLFSGIGGFTLAGEWAGFKTIAFCEKEEFCQKVLKKHWPEIPIIEEIRDFDGAKWRGATLLTGGFPCQPFSVAGQRRGKEDDRYLWPEMLKVIKEAKPHWIFAENVPGIFRMALDTVLADLEGEGYTAGTFIIPACGLNAPHKRNRVWIIANSIDDGMRRGSHGNSEGGKRTLQTERSNSHAPDSDRFNGNDAGFGSGKIPQQKKTEIQRSENLYISKGIDSNPTKQFRGTKQRLRQSEGYASREAIRNAWQISWLEVAACFCRVDDGISDRIHRLKALGNAIVPQIAYEILKKIAWIENERTSD